MNKDGLDNIKNEVQKILNNHLEENQRFSIQDFNEDSIYLLIDLLLEKDDKKRELIRLQINKKMTTNKMNIELTYEKILEINDKLNNLKNNYNDLINLKNTFTSDFELDNQLNNI